MRGKERKRNLSFLSFCIVCPLYSELKPKEKKRRRDYLDKFLLLFIHEREREEKEMQEKV